MPQIISQKTKILILGLKTRFRLLKTSQTPLKLILASNLKIIT